ncbi:Protoheme IX farnesyltransferase, mitochondrial, partial [Sporothrix epigloea]
MPPPGPVALLLRIRGCTAGAASTWRAGDSARLWATHVPVRVPRTSLRQPPCHAFTTLPRRSASAAADTPNRRRGGSVSTTNEAPAEDEYLIKSYFLSNPFMDRIAGLSPGSTPHASTEALPHRRRQAARRKAKQEAAAAAAAASSSSSTLPSTSTISTAALNPPSITPYPSASPSDASSPEILPENASTILSDMAARQPTTSLRRLASSLLSLAKPRLTVLVVLTAMAPYALYPVPSFLSSELLETTPSLSPLTLLFLTTGTALCSASANALNMLYEPDTDARMSRTRNRPLVRMLVSRRAALLFAVACGIVGIAALQWGVNPTVAFLGAANIALYAGVYTPMKRLSVLNTWVGALVGGIPPLMGWAAAAGQS